MLKRLGMPMDKMNVGIVENIGTRFIEHVPAGFDYDRSAERQLATGGTARNYIVGKLRC
jgi:hypothetical protein